MKHTRILDIYLDAEWSSINKLLTVQIMYRTFDGKTRVLIVFTEHSFSLLYQKQIELKSMCDVKYMITPNEETVFETVLEEISRTEDLSEMKRFQTHFYYSIRDLQYFFGRDAILEQIHRKRIYSLNNLHGSFYQEFKGGKHLFVLNDYSGWIKKGGFQNLCATLGIDMPWKNSLDDTKSSMERCFENQERFDIFIHYAIDDVKCLSKVALRMNALLNKISSTVLHLPVEYQFEPEDTPSTLGSIVAKLFQNFILD